jgi:hypothetical protein
VYALGSEFANVDVTPLSLAPPNAHRCVVASFALQSAHDVVPPGKKFKPLTVTVVSLPANTTAGATLAAYGGRDAPPANAHSTGVTVSPAIATRTANHPNQ